MNMEPERILWLGGLTAMMIIFAGIAWRGDRPGQFTWSLEDLAPISSQRPISALTP